MRLVFPTDENMGYLSKRGAHFGKAKFYTIITLVENKIDDVEVVVNPGHSGGACGSAVENIMGLKPDALIVGALVLVLHKVLPTLDLICILIPIQLR